jgi:hypothetical protein
MSETTHPIRCRCGQFQAEVANPEQGTRAVCYCKDCQAFAHFLGLPAGMLDPFGGTDIVAVRPGNVRLLAGEEHLACMSLTPKGTLRWYTRCCRTPVGNTPRDMRLAHVGLVHTALEAPGQDLTPAFGPVKMRVNRQSAHGTPPASPPVTFLVALASYLSRLLWARATGKYKANPFFDGATGRPRVEPQVLSAEEHRALKAAVAAAGVSAR